MAHVTLSRTLPSPPDRTWDVVSDPSRFEEWNALHSAWVTGPPERLEVGSSMVETVVIKGVRDTITFVADVVDEPRHVRLSGNGTLGSTVRLDFTIEPASGERSTVTLDLEFTSSMLFGPVGRLIERAFHAQLETSLETLAGLVAVP